MADSGETSFSWYVDSMDTVDLSLDVNHHPNTGDNVPMQLTLSKNGASVTQASVSAEAIKPFDFPHRHASPHFDLNFTTTGNGVWTETYQFDLNGTYHLDFNVTDVNNADGNASFHVYVGTYDLNLSFLNPSTSLWAGQLASFNVLLADMNANYIDYADLYLSLDDASPSNAAMTPLGAGQYTHSYTLPSTPGTYNLTVTAASGVNRASRTMALTLSQAPEPVEPSIGGETSEGEGQRVLNLVSRASTSFNAVQGENLRLDLPDGRHQVFVRNVFSDRVVLEVRSNPVIVELELDQPKELDLDGDGEADVIASLKGVREGQAEFLFERPVPEESEPGQEPEPGAEPTPPVESPESVSITPEEVIGGIRGMLPPQTMLLSQEQYFGLGNTAVLCVLIHFLWTMLRWRFESNGSFNRRLHRKRARARHLKRK